MGLSEEGKGGEGYEARSPADLIWAGPTERERSGGLRLLMAWTGGNEHGTVNG